MLEKWSDKRGMLEEDWGMEGLVDLWWWWSLLSINAPKALWIECICTSYLRIDLHLTEKISIYVNLGKRLSANNYDHDVLWREEGLRPSQCNNNNSWQLVLEWGCEWGRGEGVNNTTQTLPSHPNIKKEKPISLHSNRNSQLDT